LANPTQTTGSIAARRMQAYANVIARTSDWLIADRADPPTKNLFMLKSRNSAFGHLL
jgi:hypothetical protein